MILQNYFVLIILLGMAAIFLVVWLLERARQKKLEDAAKKNGLLFIRKQSEDKSAYNYVSGFSIANSVGIFSFMPQTQIKNIFINQDSFRLFEYERLTGSGKNRSRTRYTCIRGAVKKEIPDFVLRNENILDKIGAFFGYDDVDFERNKEFSKRYCLKSNSPNIKTFFNNDLLGFFEREKTEYSIETKGKEVLLYRKGRLTRPEDCIAALKEGEKIIQKLDAAGKDGSRPSEI
jgi:hypothetical protein